MNQYKAHQELSNEFRYGCGQSFMSELRLFNRPVGKFFIRRIVNNVIDYLPMKINKVGQADMYGVYFLKINQVLTISIHIEIEIKSGKAQLSKDQINWRDWCLNNNIPWFLVRDAKEGVHQIDIYMQNLRGKILNAK